MSVKCLACNGTGKGIAGLQGAGVQLGPCIVCQGTGSVSEAMVAALKSAKKGGADVSDTPIVKKPKKKPGSAVLPDVGTSAGGVLKNVGSEVASAFMEAGKQKLAAEAALKMVDVSKQLAASLGYQIPPNPMIDKALALGMPVLLMIGVQMLASSDQAIIPKGLLDNINAASSYALKGVSKETVDELAQVALPFLLQIAAIGAGTMSGQLSTGSGQLGPGQAILEAETTE